MRVGIVGIGQTKFGKISDTSSRELAAEAFTAHEKRRKYGRRRLIIRNYPGGKSMPTQYE